MFKNSCFHVLKFIQQPELEPQGGEENPAQSDDSGASVANVEDTSTQTEEAEQTSQDVNWEEEAKKWRRLSRQNEQKAKSNAKKAKAYDELQEAQMSELEKVSARLEEMAKENSKLRRNAALNDVAARYMVPAHLLTGSTKEELEQSAQALLEFKGTMSAATSAKTAGKKGEQVTAKSKQLTQTDLEHMSYKEILEANRAGQLNQLKGLVS